ncbi:glycine C-acetyltransferase [Lewinella sp. W8]|uniref:glycine C-acetyltransferase n=1 Tax=Lewinella sp. W8 TaxID=2528208 RepID=UPI0020A67C13|nr:glycine C-acetyltransferase [Lewinella sp. W8]
MNKQEMYADLQTELDQLRAEGLYKEERIITSPQAAEIVTQQNPSVLNFCANNYLGLSSHPDVVAAGKEAIDGHGFGLSSVRFICGTQDIHKELEARIAKFVGTEDAILYAAAFDANGGLFEPLLGPEDAIVSDQLNHASIIDGIRLCKAKRYRYLSNDMDDLRAKLSDARAAGARRIIVATDGVFSMDGVIAQVDKIVAIAKEFGALVMVDDCHATGFTGKTGRGSAEHCGVFGEVDIITGTFGKALGGASGGFTAAKKEVVDMLRQKSRPYLFSNTLAPSIVGASIKVLDVLSHSTELRDKLESNTQRFREGMTAAGFDIIPGVHPIVPVMLYDAALSQKFADALLEEGIYVIGFFYPVVPKGKARIRVQISAGHEPEHIDKAIAAFTKVGKDLGVI